MHLKRLELVGFKSFAQKTVLDFPAGITAVVGPNGSGKSNIIDAVRWLLGEREAKNMRGLKAEDLIFAGTPDRPRIGLAQATIVFDNHNKFFPVDFAEVAIRRRIERDGTSQYFLNEAEVRLRDVIDFFAKSRLGTKGFSIINQGDSDLFVRAIPKERRDMLEEILGLRQFQIKKHEANLKLKSTKFNMEKATALIEELLPHLRLLRRQTAKWEKHGELEAELRNLEEKYFGHKLKEIEEALQKIDPDLEYLESEIKSRRAELKRLEDDLEKITVGEPKQDRELEKWQRERKDLLERRSAIQRELGRFEARIEMLARGAESDFDPSHMVKLLEEAREFIEDILYENNIVRIKKVLQALFDKLNRLLDGEEEGGIKKGELSDLEFSKTKLSSELDDIERKLSAFANLEKNISDRYRQFNDIFKKAYEAVEKKKNEVSVLESKKSKLIFDRERAVIYKEELARSAIQVGRKLDEFSPARHDAGFDIQASERRIFKLRGELAGIGEIDQGLIKEAEETETRHKFLSTQLADLEKAHKDLLNLIRELETRIHDDFSGAMKNINDEFQKYFKMMFGGGHAKLKLKTHNSQLTTDNEKGDAGEVQKNGENEGSREELGGLDIEISIPRKRITGLDMLSGGEKSLVSLAVLFALIAVSPPPFLVLDEVDAALDEANTKRFADLIKDFSHKTQFLVVTHNRATMEAAGVLYGVTMGEDGTSRVLSLKLE